jgi:ankyrin repeat protein
MASDANEKLVEAARRSDVGEMKRLIAAGADPSALVGHWTPLLWAAANGRVDSADVLVKAGARVDGEDKYGSTPLMYAAGSGHAAMIDALLDAGADVHHANHVGNTALYEAARNGHLAAARALVEAGAVVDVRNSEGTRPIDMVRVRAIGLGAGGGGGEQWGWGSCVRTCRPPARPVPALSLPCLTLPTRRRRTSCWRSFRRDATS